MSANRTTCAYKLAFFAGIFVLLFCSHQTLGQLPGRDSHLRKEVELGSGWRTQLSEASDTYAGFEHTSFDDGAWKTVDVPHNWQGYSYDRQDVHGSKHGSAWYRTKFRIARLPRLERTFLLFEGVNSYATIWLNGRQVGTHAGGLTTFTIDVTDAVRYDAANLLAVRADNPRHIQDLPWVSGDDSDVVGFAEGAQPLGIFRPVHIIQTSGLRIEPFGVDIWCGAKTSEHSANVHVSIDLRNYGSTARSVEVLTEMLDREGRSVESTRTSVQVNMQSNTTVKQDLPELRKPHLWSLDEPYLYRVHTVVRERRRDIDDLVNDFGVRWISWPTDANGAIKPGGQFLLNGKPVPIRGISEYEHLLGASHAFSPEQVAARVHMVEAAGFNAFRDAHYPHNLLYQSYWDRDGLLWWPQFSAHIYFDNPGFRDNFKRLLSDWVKERRNSPSLILWGLQNESVLPTEFAKESVRLIRSLDPTASSQRLIVTCNFGTGTDWNVPQNWSGTYAGQLAKYGDELQQEVLVGEYGAWRSLGFHADPMESIATTATTEDRMAAVMETKVRLAEGVAEHSAGQFAWILATHENPGRLMREDGVQIDDGIRALDHIGPVNNKGLFTLAGEPLDAFYMYRSNYVPATKQPMVYIASHTWPDRWVNAKIKPDVIIYSNCDEVELFNDVGGTSLGVQRRGGIGTHFTWTAPDLKYNMLYAVGRVNGRAVATDTVTLIGLPQAPHATPTHGDAMDLTAVAPGQHYLYRVHTGGPDYRDAHGSLWLADQLYDTGTGWGFQSWAEAYTGLDPELGSRGITYDSISGTTDPGLFRTYRYGREELRYRFRVRPGQYRVELFFSEPWYGRAGINAKGWRLFDVAVNGQTELKDVDIWNEAGPNHGIKKVITAAVQGDELEISFPRVSAGQAILSAIAITTHDASLAEEPQQRSDGLVNLSQAADGLSNGYEVKRYFDIGDTPKTDEKVYFASIPPTLLDADWLQQSVDKMSARPIQFEVTQPADVYALLNTHSHVPTWLESWTDTKLDVTTVDGKSIAANRRAYRAYRKTFQPSEAIIVGSTEDGPPLTVLVTRDLPSHVVPESEPRKPEVYSLDNASLVNGVPNVPGTFRAGAAGISWRVYLGLSASYHFTIRYTLDAEERFGSLRIADSHGNEIDSSPVRLSKRAGGHKGEAAEQTLSLTIALNAGDYDLSLQLPEAEGLKIASLTVQ